MQNYDKRIRALQLEREFTNGKVCRNAEHKNHVLATTYSCLREVDKLPYQINHYRDLK